MEENQRINETIQKKKMGVKLKHLLPIIMEGQQLNIFTNAIRPDELVHIIMESFRLLMFKWRISNFQFDLLKDGNTLIQSLLTLIKTK